ncbi:MAG TPA: cytochrome C biogenesis protein ResB [Desulfuromonadales bacterium]|nr:cytochrome C biogenesis protein ResB [Desulfuromonadales bacterium]
MNRLWKLLISLEAGLLLLAMVCIAMAAGSFSLSGDAAAVLNSMPLFDWLREFSFAATWWLWLTLVLLALLVLNTVCCSADNLLQRFSRTGLLTWLPPQLIHAGFLLIVLAHLQSSIWGFKGSLEVPQGGGFQLPDGTGVQVANIGAIFSPMAGNMPLGYRALIVTGDTRTQGGVTISPNHPWFSGGYGVYIKHALPGNPPTALLEVHREAGAATALAGALLFTVGNLLLLYTRSRAHDLP